MVCVYGGKHIHTQIPLTGYVGIIKHSAAVVKVGVAVSCNNLNLTKNKNTFLDHSVHTSGPRLWNALENSLKP